MTVLLDTNLLTRSVQPASAQFQAATDAIRLLHRQQANLCIVPQNLYEFWSVCTRPAGENGLGLSVPEAHAELIKILSLFTLLPDTPAICGQWQRMVVQYEAKGKNSHDARLVAAMNIHGVDTLLTFNVKDFSRYEGITILAPEKVVQA